MDILYALVVIIVAIILLVVLLKVLDMLFITPLVFAQDPDPIIEDTLDTGPAQIVINQSNSTECLRVK